MQRIGFLLPDETLAGKVVRSLQDVHIGAQDIALMARDPHKAMDAPPPHALHRRGRREPVLLGTATARVAGLDAACVPGAGFLIGGELGRGIRAAGIEFADWLAALMDAPLPDADVAYFQRAVSEGQVLMIVNSAPNKLAQMHRRVVQQHSATRFAVAGANPQAKVS